MTLQQFAHQWVCIQFPSTLGRTQHGKDPDELMQGYIYFHKAHSPEKSQGGEEEASKGTLFDTLR